MKVETFADVIDWTCQLHKELADCLRKSKGKHADQRANLLIDYLAGHEAEMAKIFDGMRDDADARALKTWVYEWIDHPLVDPKGECHLAFKSMSEEEILQAVFQLHDRVISLHRLLLTKSQTPGTTELLTEMLEAEEHNTKLMAQQSNRLHDI